MLNRLFRRTSPADNTATALYAAIVAQARAPGFYLSLGVPDTVEGRLEMVMLHTAIVLRRLRDGSAAERETGQAVFDLFCKDLDRSLRELGVGDLGVPKKMKKIAEGFYGRLAAYDPGLAGDPGALAAAIGRNVFGGGEGHAAALAAYAIAAARHLADTSESAIRDGHLYFPDPAAHISAT